jgi:hypothetical protein
MYLDIISLPLPVLLRYVKEFEIGVEDTTFIHKNYKNMPIISKGKVKR